MTRPFKLSKNAEWLIKERYLQPFDVDFSDVCSRVACILAAAAHNSMSCYNKQDKYAQRMHKSIYADMTEGRFMFNSPCLFSAGCGFTGADAELIRSKEIDQMSGEIYSAIYEKYQSHKDQQLFACFVVGVEDSMAGIMQSLSDTAIITKYGGGVGVDFSALRAAGKSVNGGVGGVAKGPVSFLSMWDNMGSIVVQGSKRQAALMGILRDDHPDIMEFINAKTKDGVLPYFNLSVSVSDLTMDSNGELLTAIAESAWKRGDPGLFFRDTANSDNIMRNVKGWTINTTNPCGEQPLPDYTACNLGSINLVAFVDTDNNMDWAGLGWQIRRSIGYLDAVIDATNYPLHIIEERTKYIRPVGLGLMGLADAALIMGIKYGSDQFVDFCTKVGELFAVESMIATVELANILGPCLATTHIVNVPPTPTITAGIEAIKKLKGKEKAEEIAGAYRSGLVRNTRRLSIAPTGTISMLFDVSSGIEPIFHWDWQRRVKVKDGNNEVMLYSHPFVALKHSAAAVLAHDLTWQEHHTAVAAFARFVDSGISKTYNLPNSATVQDVIDIYKAAWECKTKGVTIYRDGSRTMQPISTNNTPATVGTKAKQKRPVGVLPSKTLKETTPWGSIHATMTMLDGKPFEVFFNLGSNGQVMNELTAGLGRAISIGLRSGADIEEFIKSFRNMASSERWSPNENDSVEIRGLCGMAAYCMDRLIRRKEAINTEAVTGLKCPECSSPMDIVSGCLFCFSCGHSPCK